MWFARARPVDYMLAMSEFYASLPLVGKHLEPLGGFTAMGVWGYRHAPHLVSAAVRSRAPGAASQRRQEREMTNEVAAAALGEFVSPERIDVTWPPPGQAGTGASGCRDSGAAICIAAVSATETRRPNSWMSGGGGI